MVEQRKLAVILAADVVGYSRAFKPLSPEPLLAAQNVTMALNSAA